MLPDPLGPQPSCRSTSRQLMALKGKAIKIAAGEVLIRQGALEGYDETAEKCGGVGDKKGFAEGEDGIVALCHHSTVCHLTLEDSSVLFASRPIRMVQLDLHNSPSIASTTGCCSSLCQASIVTSRLLPPAVFAGNV